MDTYDVRYDYLTCAKCGHAHQVMDWSGYQHEAECGQQPRARMSMNGEELAWCLDNARPGEPIGFPFGLIPHGAQRDVELPHPIACALLMRRNGQTSVIR